MLRPLRPAACSPTQQCWRPLSASDPPLAPKHIDESGPQVHSPFRLPADCKDAVTPELIPHLASYPTFARLRTIEMTANVVGEHPRPVVYRLQGIPEYVKTLDQVKEVLRHGRGELHDICEPEIFSLATGIPHARTSRPTKVATLMFNPRHSSRQQQHEPANLNPESIIQSVNCVKDGLVLDSDFLGLTPLNDISVGVHQHE